MNAPSLSITDAVDLGWGGNHWDRVVDVIVVGSGVAGGSAAAAASRANASVLILEKSPAIGGTTARSGGGMWIPNHFGLRNQGLMDERDRMLRYMARSAYPAKYRSDHPTLGCSPIEFALLERFFDEAARIVDELVADRVLDLLPYGFPDYYSDLPECVPWGHSLVPRLPEGWQRGDPGGGDLLTHQLVGACQSRGNEVLLDCQVTGVLRNVDGEIVGVEARHRRGTLLLGARRGLVFGSGGFLHDEQLAADWLRGPVFGGAAAASSTGDFVRIASGLGVSLATMTHGWWTQLVVEQALRHRVTSRDVFNAYGDSMIMVNRLGHRVMNEKSPYSDRGQVHFCWDSGRHEYINRLVFMIFDEAVRTSDLRHDQGIHGSKLGRYPVPFPEEANDYVISGADFDELASNIDQRLLRMAGGVGGVRLDPEFRTNLGATISRFNDHARAGYDPDFRRGETLIERAWATTTRADAKSDSMYPISGNGPYHCVILGAGALDTKGGPRTDVDGRVLEVGGQPIPGLYGAGNCVASPSGQAYWGPGATIGLGLTFGYLAGTHAAAERVRSGALTA